MLKKLMCICLVVLLALPAMAGFSEVIDGEATTAHPRTEPMNQGDEIVDYEDAAGAWSEIDPLGLLSRDAGIFGLSEDEVYASPKDFGVPPEADFEFYGLPGIVGYSFYGGNDGVSEFTYTIAPQSYDELEAAFDAVLEDMIDAFGDGYEMAVYDSETALADEVFSYSDFDADYIREAYEYDGTSSFFFDTEWNGDPMYPVLSVYIAKTEGTPGGVVNIDLTFHEPYYGDDGSFYAGDDIIFGDEETYSPSVDDFIGELMPEGWDVEVGEADLSETPEVDAEVPGDGGYDPLGLLNPDAAGALAELTAKSDTVSFSMAGVEIYVAPVDYYGSEGMAICIAEEEQPVIVMYLAAPQSYDEMINMADKLLTGVALDYGMNPVMGVMDYEGATGEVERDGFTLEEIQDAYDNVDSRITYAYLWQQGEGFDDFDAMVGIMLNEDGFDGGKQDYVCAAFMPGSFSDETISALDEFGSGVTDVFSVFG